MRGRVTAYKSVSYTAFALLSKMRLLDFCRIVLVEREGVMVRRMVNAVDLTPEERARIAS